MDFGLATRGGRALLAADGCGLDIETASQGRFPADAMEILRRWDEFLDWAAGAALRSGEPLDPAELGPCVPQPQKVFGIGLNYRDHAEEAGLPIPDEPLVFTKFPNCLAGPRAEIPLGGSERVDFEVELVVAIGRGGRDIPAARALEYVAGYCVGQDISDRRVQFAGKPPQFSLGKSRDGFGPIGPWLSPRAAIADPHALALRCDVSGESMQRGNTRDMIFGVAELIEALSRGITLAPGDLIFTGTPAGVGSVRTPRRYLRAGDRIHSAIENLGELDNVCRDA